MIRRRPYAGQLTAPSPRGHPAVTAASRRDDRRVTARSPQDEESRRSSRQPRPWPAREARRAAILRALIPLWESIPPDWASDEIFLCALDRLAATSVTEDMVLFRYLLVCLPSMVPDVQVKVREWMAPIALRLQVDMVRLEQEIAQQTPRSVRASAIIEEPVVLVRIVPMTIGGYKIDGWLFPNGYPASRQHIDLPVEVTAKEFGAELAAENIHTVVRYARQQLKGDADVLRVEALLPSVLLRQAIDRDRVKISPSLKVPLGVHYPLVLRSYERLYDPQYREYWGSWKTRWERCKLPATLLQEADLCVVERPDEYGEPLYYRLAQHGVMLVGITPPHDSPESFAEMLDPVLTTGTPLVLWLRKKTEDTRVVKQELQGTIFQQALSKLPGSLKHFRLKRAEYLTWCARNGEAAGGAAGQVTAPPAPWWDDVVLLWDDYSRRPADIRDE
jgi:hypothetical protein